ILKEGGRSHFVPGIKLWFGEYFYGKGDFAGAQKYFSETIEEFPASPFSDDAAYWLGWAMYDTDMVSQSLTQFESVVEKRPSSKWAPQAILALGDIYRKTGDDAKAISQYETLIQKYPENEITNIANNRIGTLLKSQGKYALAVEYFRIALTGENSETNAQLQFDIAECHENMDMEGEAIEGYLKVEYKYPLGRFWVMRARLKCAELLEKHGENERAFKLYQKLASGEGTEAEYAKEKIKLLK
ncbi:tol-pal system YbgF family protein, partial [Candidatus Omnitrophota bacterium]